MTERQIRIMTRVFIFGASCLAAIAAAALLLVISAYAVGHA